jgi:hypothetical protein
MAYARSSKRTRLSQLSACPDTAKEATQRAELKNG